MKCFLIAYIDSDNYEIISGYSKLPGFEHLNEESLEDIVAFTNMFDSPIDLINFLIENNLIKRIRNNTTIKILKTKDNKHSIGEVSYKGDSQLFNENILINEYYKLASNIKFIEAFLNKYYSILIKNPIIDINSLKYCYELSIKNKKPTGSINILLASIINDTINSAKTKEQRFEIIRSFAMFIIDFRREQNKNNNITTNLDLIRHYKSLLENGDITDEEKSIYESELKKLEQEETDILNITLHRERKWKKNNGNKNWC